MSKKQWFILFFVFIAYLLAGAAIFHYVEYEQEMKNRKEEKEERIIIEELLKKLYQGGHVPQKTLFSKLTEYCGKPVKIDMSQHELPIKWDYFNSIFFVITVVSTIGYGNLAPTTMFGRIFMIFYGLVGIPMNGIVMVTLSRFFGKSFTKLHRRWKSTNINYSTARFGLIGQIILYLVPGFTFFIILPSVVMAIYEGWNYDVAVYYAFVSLTTIGFGDYVAGVDNIHNLENSWQTTYKIFLLVWLIGGLGYVVMVLGFITQGMQSKKIIQLEHVIRDNIKKTPRRIRNELRSLVREFLLLKVKPQHSFEYIPSYNERRSSCPDLTVYDDSKSTSSSARKRALSVCPYGNVFEIESSDSFIESINYQKDLLLQVVDALSHNSDESDSESDTFPVDQRDQRRQSVWSILSKKSVHPKKRRAVSDIRQPRIEKLDISQNSWHGKQTDSFRKRTMSCPSDTLHQTRSFVFQKLRNRFKKEDKNVDIEKQNVTSSFESIFTPEEENYINHNRGRRPSTMSIHQEAVLENTSIADLIRALTAVAKPDKASNKIAPQRKTGCAGILSPILPQSKPTRLYNPNNNRTRRTSLMPSPNTNQFRNRRFSLRPVEEHNLGPPPPYDHYLEESEIRNSDNSNRFGSKKSGSKKGSSDSINK